MTKRKKIKLKKITSFSLSALMIIGMLPINALALDRSVKSGLELPVELNSSNFTFSGLNTNGTVDNRVASIVTDSGKQWFKIGDRNNAPHYDGQMQHTGGITSKYQLDFNNSFEVVGTMKMGTAPDGFAFSFHDNKDFLVSNQGGSLGIYERLRNAMVFEIDTHKNVAHQDIYGDNNFSAFHITANITNSAGNVVSVKSGRDINPNEDISTSGKDYKLVWNSSRKQMTYTINSSSITSTFTDTELNNIVGSDRLAYFSITGVTNFAWPGSAEYYLNLKSVKYTELSPQVNTQFFVNRNGTQTEINSSSKLLEEDIVTVKHSYSNTGSVPNSFNMKTYNNITLDGNKISVEDRTEPYWYKPYIQKNSFTSNSNNVNREDFFNGNNGGANIVIPANKGINTIEYKIVIPKVLGSNNKSLNYDLKLGNIGMNYLQFTGNRTVDGSPALSITDSNLKNALIENIKSPTNSGNIINDSRPNYSNVYQKELEAMKTLNLSGKSINNLQGLQYATNVKEINLSNNGFTNIEFLKSLSKLEILNLSFNPKAKLTFNLFNNNANFNALKDLNISNCELENSDIGNFNNLNLNVINLNNNKIYDLTSIKKLLDNITNAEITGQNVTITPTLNIGTVNFEHENIVKNKDGAEKTISFPNNALFNPTYSSDTNLIIWENITLGSSNLLYNWKSNTPSNIKYDGSVSLSVNKSSANISNQKIITQQKDDGTSEVITNSNNLFEGKKITIYEEYYNTDNSSNEYERIIQLPKIKYSDDAGNDEMEYATSVKPEAQPYLYEPYFVSGSAKMYIGDYTSTASQTSIDDDFFSGTKKIIKIPKNSGKITVKYDIILPDVIGHTNSVSQNISISSQLGETFNGTFLTKSAIRKIKGELNVAVPDSNLKKELNSNLRTQFDKRPTFYNNVYEKELNKLTNDLLLSDKNILNLEGLQHCINVKNIDLSKNQFTDISILKSLNNLEKLNLSNNIQAKSSFNLFKDNNNFKGLKELSLKSNDLFNEDLASFVNLTKLNVLDLDDNHISDLTPIKNLFNSSRQILVNNQTVTITPDYINSGNKFAVNSIIKDKDGKIVDISSADNGGIASGIKVTWENLPVDVNAHNLSYNWNKPNYNGKVSLKVNQVQDPTFMVVIPSQLILEDNVQDENSIEYDPKRDPNSLEYDPSVSGNNPIVSGIVGNKSTISIVADKQIEGNINIYSNSVFKMNEIIDSDDIALVSVYKTFNDKLTGTASSKQDKLLSLNNNSKKGVFRIKAPKSEFKTNLTTYEGVMTFVIEYDNPNTTKVVLG